MMREKCYFVESEKGILLRQVKGYFMVSTDKSVHTFDSKESMCSSLQSRPVDSTEKPRDRRLIRLKYSKDKQLQSKEGKRIFLSSHRGY